MELMGRIVVAEKKRKKEPTKKYIFYIARELRFTLKTFINFHCTKMLRKVVGIENFKVLMMKLLIKL